MSRLRAFAGPRVTAYIGLGLLVGLTLSAAELAFAWGLQSFLVAIGALAPTTASVPAWIPRASLAQVFGFLLAVGTLRALMNSAQLYLAGAAHETLQDRLRSALLRWALHSESASSAQVTTLFVNRATAAGQAVNGLQNLVIQIASGAALAVALLRMSPMVTVAAGGMLVLIALPLLIADRRLLAAGVGLGTESERVNSRMLMSLKNLLLLQIYGTQGEEEAATQRSLAAYRGHVLEYYRISAFKYALPQILGVGLICAIAWAARRGGVMTPGALVSYFYLLLRALQIFSAANQALSSLLVQKPQVAEMLAWWDAHGAQSQAPRPAADAPALPGLVGWSLRDVSFAYPGAGKPALSDLSLDIAPGEALVVLGPSGAGKSTLLGILLGTLKPAGGTVEAVHADGRREPLEAARPSLFPAIGYVGPESFLVEGTVRRNLTYGLRGEASAAELDEALALAECGFVKDLPMGLEHPLTEQGQGLSAGQKQRLSLARALLRRPKLLILDEATSNLDFATETRLVETLSRLKRRMTIVAVTHRPTMLDVADKKLELGA